MPLETSRGRALRTTYVGRFRSPPVWPLHPAADFVTYFVKDFVTDFVKVRPAGWCARDADKGSEQGFREICAKVTATAPRMAAVDHPPARAAF